MSVKVLSVASPKGGVGKTVSVAQLAATLAARDERVLVIDLDPQGAAGAALGLDPASRGPTTRDLLVGEGVDGVEIRAPIAELPELRVLPGDLGAAVAERELLGRPRTGSLALARRLPSLRDRFDRILIDCPASLSALTLNAVLAADAVLVPLGAAMALELRAAQQLFRLIEDLRSETQLTLTAAAFVSRARPRQSLAKEGLQAASELFGESLLDVVVPESVEVEKSVVSQLPLALSSPRGKPTTAFAALADALTTLAQPVTVAVEARHGA
jgi:chromosome partitioning protein